jgi:RimJ/RimL family protein N-acetyltransferase
MPLAVSSLLTPKGNIIIRPAGLADLLQLSELRLEALRDNPTFFGSSYEARENCGSEWTLRMLNTDPQEGCSFVAEFGQELFGMAAIRRFPGIKTRHSANIGGVYLRPEWRRQGIVDRLIEACLDWSMKQQVINIKLAVVTTNLAALKAYQRLGFSIYGKEPKVILHEGVYYDEYLMSKSI